MIKRLLFVTGIGNIVIQISILSTYAEVPVSSNYIKYNSFPKGRIAVSPVVTDTTGLILQIMRSNQSFFGKYMDSAKSFEIQAIYTQINRDSLNHPSFRSYSYRLNDKEYFTPASTSKLPVLLIALEKLKKLGSKGIDKYTAMHYDSARACQKCSLRDTVAEDSILNVGHYIQKILLVSDNDAYNRLYEFIGQKAINKRLWEMGFKKSCIIQQFNYCDPKGNRYTNPLKFIDKSGKIIYSQPLVKNHRRYKNPLGNVVKGIGYLDDNGKLIRQPRSFKYYNNIPLRDLHDMMLRVIFPDNFDTDNQFQINKEDYSFLYRYMSMYPRESEFHKYHDSIRYPDNRKKYLMFGTDSFKHITDSTIRIFNIVGQLSGYLTDCAYIVDFKNQVEFILAVTIYNNQSGIFDVSNYRYKTIGFPFLQEFGHSIYKYELARPRKYLPDLSELKNCVDNPFK